MSRRHTILFVALIALYATLMLQFATHIAVVGAETGPQVHCVAVGGTDGLVQLDCYGSVMQEVYERLIPRYGVYDALRPIASEWSFDLYWTEV